MARRIPLLIVFVTLFFPAGTFAQPMPGMGRQPCQPMPMGQPAQPCAPMKMPMMGPGLSTPDLLVTSFEKQVVVPDEAIPFANLGMGKDFFGKLIARVDFGKGVWFSVRKARILPGGDVGVMRTGEICYIEEGLGLIIDGQGKMPPKVVPAGSWFTVPTNWPHTLRNIGQTPLIMHVIRVGPKEIH